MMNILRYAIATLTTTALVHFLQAEAKSNVASPPNVILMVADDLGYADLSCYGAKAIATPRLDRLAEQGARFTDAHSFSGICMPSRYSILSGRYAFRTRMVRGYAGHFEPSQVLLPMVMKSAGYRTAMIGKWHNGFGTNPDVDWNAPLMLGPVDFGFESFFGTPRTHSEPPLVLMRDRTILGLEQHDPISVDHSPGTGAHGKQIGGAKAMAMRPDEKLDLMQAEEAEQWLKKQTAKEPFFLYLAWQAPHNPINPAPEFQKKSKAGRYGDYIQQLDHCVGRVLDALEKTGLAENTIVVFTSDNAGRYESGAMRVGHRTNGALLGQKTDVWEGGHRVPFLVRWPGHVPAKSVRGAYFHHVDLMATFADSAGAKMPEGASPDGSSELAAFLDPEKSPAKRVEGIHHGTSSLALRQGTWIYVPKQGSGGKSAPQGEKPWSMSYRDMKFLNSDVDEMGKIKTTAAKEQLYDLKMDLPQSNNLAAKEPERLEQMRKRFEEITASPSKAR